jgi:hypothetical protein
MKRSPERYNLTHSETLDGARVGFEAGAEIGLALRAMKKASVSAMRLFFQA